MPIRHAQPSDLPEIVAIYNASIPGRMATADTTPVTVESRRAWFAEFDAAVRPLWVVDDGGVQAWLSMRSFYGRPAYATTVETGITLRQARAGAGMVERCSTTPFGRRRHCAYRPCWPSCSRTTGPASRCSRPPALAAGAAARRGHARWHRARPGDPRVAGVAMNADSGQAPAAGPGTLNERSFRIAKATPVDVPDIHRLIVGLAEYERLQHLCISTPADIERGLFGSHPAAEVLLARDADPTAAAVGFALFFPTYSTFLAVRACGWRTCSWSRRGAAWASAARC